MTMTVRELIDALEDFPEDAEVRLAHQPNYPLQFEVAAAVHSSQQADYDEPDCDEHGAETDRDDDGALRCIRCGELMDPEPDEDEPGIVWLVEGDHPSDTPYGPRWVFESV